GVRFAFPGENITRFAPLCLWPIFISLDLVYGGLGLLYRGKILLDVLLNAPRWVQSQHSTHCATVGYYRDTT
ncbi:hypothetical protein SK128_004149, partial [Halocaridina rubra]